MSGIRPERTTRTGKCLRDAGLFLVGAGIASGVALGLVSVAEDMGVAMTCLPTEGNGSCSTQEASGKLALYVGIPALAAVVVGETVVFASQKVERRIQRRHITHAFSANMEELHSYIDTWRTHLHLPPLEDDQAS